MLRTAKSDPTDPAEQLDLHKILKTCYFADKRAINEIGCPIFGAKYIAMRYGPVPVEIYEMLKCEPIWLGEMLEDGVDDYPWDRERFHVFLKDGQDGAGGCDNIAPADMPLIKEEFAKCRAMTFTQRTRETHGMDWMLGCDRPGNVMAYEDIISETRPDRDAMIADLRENAPYFALQASNRNALGQWALSRRACSASVCPLPKLPTMLNFKLRASNTSDWCQARWLQYSDQDLGEPCDQRISPGQSTSYLARALLAECPRK